MCNKVIAKYFQNCFSFLRKSSPSYGLLVPLFWIAGDTGVSFKKRMYPLSSSWFFPIARKATLFYLLDYVTRRTKKLRFKKKGNLDVKMCIAGM